MKTDSTSWSQLSAEIQMYKKRAKMNLQSYERQRFNNLYKKKYDFKNKSQENVTKLAQSMNLIRSKMSQERQKNLSLSTKINYLKTSRDRKMQSQQIARRKLKRVLSIRSETASQKSLLSKELSQYNETNYLKKKQLTERAKSERIRIQSERRKILSENSMRAKQVRKSRQENQQSIQYQKVLELTKKQKAVKKVQDQQIGSIQKKKYRQKEIIQQGKNNHFRNIRQQYTKLQIQKKQNAQALTNFQIQSKKIIDQTKKAQQNLQVFEKLLFKKSNKRFVKYQKNQPTLNITTDCSTAKKDSQKQYQDRNQKRKVEKTSNFYLT